MLSFAPLGDNFSCSEQRSSLFFGKFPIGTCIWSKLVENNQLNSKTTKRLFFLPRPPPNLPDVLITLRMLIRNPRPFIPRELASRKRINSNRYLLELCGQASVKEITSSC